MNSNRTLRIVAGVFLGLLLLALVVFALWAFKPWQKPAVPALPTAVPTQTPLPTATRPAATEEPTPTPLPTATAAPIEGVEEPAGKTEASEVLTETTTSEGVWRVRQVQDGSYGPELGLNRPGYGTGEFEVSTAVGVTLTFPTKSGEVVLGGGCQQVVMPPSTYCRNCGGSDWGFVSWEFNPQVTESTNEMAVLSWELAKQQVEWESCEDLPVDQLLDHVFVVEQDGEYVKLTPWREWRRPTGVDHTIMFAPGDMVYGWHIGLGNSQDNLCDGGGCYLPSAPAWGWVGGGVVNSTWPGEIPEDAKPIPQSKVQDVLESLD